MVLNYNTFKESIQYNTIVNVDIQPEYEKYISENGFSLNTWIDYLNSISVNNKIIFLYNGYDTLGMVTEYDYKNWLLELGIDERILDSATFYDKGYAFFRFCIDDKQDEDTISDLVRFMYKHNINDSRDITSKNWNKFRKEYQENDFYTGEIRDLVEGSGDCISIPDLMDFIKEYSNIVLLGGGRNECLKEVEITLKALDKDFTIDNKFVY